MRQSLLRLSFFALMLSLPAIAAWGAEPAASAKTPPEQAAKPAPGDAGAIVPERGLKFDVSDQEVPITFDLGDPQLAQQRYAASFELQFKYPFTFDSASLSQLGIENPRNDGTVSGLGDSAIVSELAQGRPGYRLLFLSWPRSAQRPFQVLASRVPRDRLPSQEVLVQLTDQARIHVRGDLSQSSNLGVPFPVPVLHMTLLAGSVDEAKQLAQGAIQLIDYGFLAPLHQKYSPILAPVERKLKEDQAKLKEAEEKKIAFEKQLEELKDYSDMTPESLATLRGQQRMITVDIAGIKARIEACNKLQAGKVTLARNEQIESVKIAAEIELIGLSAKRDALEDLTKKGERRVVARQEVQRARNAVDPLTRETALVEAHYKRLKSTFEPQTFFGEVVFLKLEKVAAGSEPSKIERLTNTIGIGPIKWVQPGGQPISDTPSEGMKSPNVSSNPGPSAGAPSPATEEPGRRPGGRTPSKGPSRSGR